MSIAWRERLRARFGRAAAPPRAGISLAVRTSLTMLLVLGVVQAAALGIHTRDQRTAYRIVSDHYLGQRVANIYRIVLDTAPALRADEIRRLAHGTPGLTRLGIAPGPDLDGTPPLPPQMQKILRFTVELAPLPRGRRPDEILIGGDRRTRHFVWALLMPDGSGWLTVAIHMPAQLFTDPTFPVAWLLMTVTASLLTLWATRRLTAPVRTLARAADALGHDVNAPPLPEDGPLEVALASAAFNRMAARIRRFVSDRTFLVTAMGHDLRTPITRLKLRCEFIDDDEIRTRCLADLDELEAMIKATLAFGRDTSQSEPAVSLDLASLLRTVLDDAADARPDHAERIVLEPASEAEHLVVRGRTLALKRCFANLVGNALNYGGSVRVTLRRRGSASSDALVLVEDDGPGIPNAELERVFEPFRRLEGSRSRETGGTGLGLSIARDIVRAHGGEITLSNRAGGGLRAQVVLPA